jgi:zinc protease
MTDAKILKRSCMFSFLFIILAMVSGFTSFSFAGEIAEREILPNGLVLLHSEKKELPIITVVVAVKAGAVDESYEKAGLANLTADLLNEGTSKRTALDISSAIDFVGGSLETSGGDDFITIKLSVLKKDRELGFDLLSDVILNPAFRQEEIDRRKAVIKSSILQQREDPGTVASKAFLTAVYGKFPYGWPTEGTLESLDRITREDIVGFHRTYYAPNKAIMAVVGDISRSELGTLLGKFFGDWMKKDIPDLRLRAPEPLKKSEVVKINRNIAQANIILGHLGIKRENPDYYAVSVMNYILGGGGFASRLMDNIRDEKGLAYDVHSYFSAKKYAGMFEAGLQTKNSSANIAIDEIVKEMKKIRTEPVSDKELADAKSYLTGSFPLRVDTNDKIAGFLVGVEFYDLGLDYIDKYKNYINSVSTADVLRVAKKYLHPEEFVLVVVGDMEKASLKY